MKSIERHLLAWLLGALSLGSLLLALVAYLVILEEMNEVFDDNLRQVALALASHRARGEPVAPAPAAAPHHLYDREGDFDYVTLTWAPDGRLRSTSDPAAALPFAPTTGLSQVSAGGERWHVYTLARADAVIQAAQRASARRALAVESASALLLPMGALVGLTAILLVMALRRGLRPLDAAADDVAARSAASLEPIAAAPLPREIHPLIGAINDLMQRLGHAFAAQRRFVADAAHELRSPVTALKLQLQLLARARDDAARAQAVEALGAGVERAQRLIEQLLSLSRVEPDAPLTAEPVDLGECVRDAVAARSAEAQHRGVDLGAESVEGVVVAADRGEIGVLLDNLVGNALRHTPAGGTVDVRAAWRDGAPTLQVVDSGAGIPEHERERVFDRFHRGESRGADGDASGSGLGLAIVRAIAERHGATVSLHTAPSGRGLEARVRFGAPGRQRLSRP